MAFEISVTRDGAVAVLTIDNPPVNALHPDVAAAIEERLAAVGPDTSIRCLVITGAGRHFMAGGDIAFFSHFRRGPSLRTRHRASEAEPIHSQPHVSCERAWRFNCSR